MQKKSPKIDSIYHAVSYILEQKFNLGVPCRLEVIQRLAHITPVELGGKAHQSQDTDNKLDQWLMYAMFACSCPSDSREGGGSAAMKELFHVIFPSLKSGSEAHVVSAC